MNERSGQMALFVIALLFEAVGFLLIARQPSHQVLGVLAIFFALGIGVTLMTWSAIR